jgi:hypothetical protein
MPLPKHYVPEVLLEHSQMAVQEAALAVMVDHGTAEDVEVLVKVRGM